MATVLIADDDADISDIISYNLSKEGIQTIKAPDGVTAIELVKKNEPTLVLLDVMMPGIDGIETCLQIRSIKGINQPIIAFLTARSEDYSQVAGFEAGGDDFIIKPIKPKLLSYRVKALLKRSSNKVEDTNKIIFDNLVIDRDKYSVSYEGQDIYLPKKQFEILELLGSNPNKIINRDTILYRIWGDDSFVSDRNIDVLIRKIRSKIGKNFIKTVKGVGYSFNN